MESWVHNRLIFKLGEYGCKRSEEIKNHHIIKIIKNFNTVNTIRVSLDAYLEEELYDLLTYCIQNPNASDYHSKEDRIKEIGQELFADGGVDALENMYFSIEHRIREEISKDAKPYRSLWNDISDEWNY